MKLSIVATLYQSALYIEEFCYRASAAAQKVVGEDFEIILVNDGSPDNSLDVAVNLADNDSHVKVVDLSRNFGHHKAMMAGLDQSIGEKIFLIDSDLEEEPEWLISFFEQMSTQKSDVVYGVQQERKGNWFERWSGSAYYTILNWLAHVHHPRNMVTARLMTRRYVDALLIHKEREIVISFLWIITGYKQCSQVVKKHMSSNSSYNLSRKLSHLINSVTSFSAAPLMMIFYSGVVIFCLSILYAIFLVAQHFILARPVDGWTSIMVSIWVLGSMIISFIGVIGIYLSKVFSEIKQRPNVIVRDIYEKSKR